MPCAPPLGQKAGAEDRMENENVAQQARILRRKYGGLEFVPFPAFEGLSDALGVGW